MHVSLNPRNGRAVRVGETIPRVLGVESPTGSAKEARRRIGWLTSRDALAIAHLRRYGYDRRAINHGAAAINLAEGRRDHGNGKRSNHYDARVVRAIDFERALDAIGGHNAIVLQMYYGDGEPTWLIGDALGISQSKANAMIAPALKLLVAELERRSLL